MVPKDRVDRCLVLRKRLRVGVRIVLYIQAKQTTLYSRAIHILKKFSVFDAAGRIQSYNYIHIEPSRSSRGTTIEHLNSFSNRHPADNAS